MKQFGTNPSNTSSRARKLQGLVYLQMLATGGKNFEQAMNDVLADFKTCCTFLNDNVTDDDLIFMTAQQKQEQETLRLANAEKIRIKSDDLNKKLGNKEITEAQFHQQLNDYIASLNNESGG